jgi:hypothetical protein
MKYVVQILSTFHGRRTPHDEIFKTRSQVSRKKLYFQNYYGYTQIVL